MSYVKNIEHYLEFFGAISEEKDYAKLLVSMNLIEIIFDSFCQTSSMKNFNSPFDKIPSDKIHTHLVSILNNVIKYCPAERSQIISNVMNIISDEEDLPNSFIQE